jgi:hypothetical protein
MACQPMMGWLAEAILLGSSGLKSMSKGLDGGGFAILQIGRLAQWRVIFRPGVLIIMDDDFAGFFLRAIQIGIGQFDGLIRIATSVNDIAIRLGDEINGGSQADRFDGDGDILTDCAAGNTFEHMFPFPDLV